MTQNCKTRRISPLSTIAITALALSSFAAASAAEKIDVNLKKQGELPPLSLNEPAEAAVSRLIVMFNGAAIDGVEANTKNKNFRPVFEKELAKLGDKLPGKPKLKIKYWYGIINGAALQIIGGTAETAEKFKALVEKQPYAKSVEPDGVVTTQKVK